LRASSRRWFGIGRSAVELAAGGRVRVS
jgi:hypothetical protein